MAEQLLARADRAFVEEDYDAAVASYSQALELEPGKAEIYEARANAHLKLEQWLDAAGDAAKAIELQPSLWKAYLRKGVACFHLEEYESAKESFEAGAALVPDNPQFKTWVRKCQAEIDEETAQAVPTPAAPPPSTPAAAQPSVASDRMAPAEPAAPPLEQAAAASSSQSAPLCKAAPPVAQGKFRHQWYQLQNKVTVDVYAKGLSPDQVHVEFQPQHLLVVISAAGSQEEEFRLDVQLYGKVDPGSCRYDVLKTKLEITMTKADTRQWGTLEASSVVAAPNYSNPAAPPVTGQYPSSYTKAPKDWNKVEAEVKDLESKGELEDGDPLNSFFKKIFSQGDEDQRRAMMKSFVESNGTVLSTNWKEVGAKTVECTPPDGMAVKKWSEA